MTLKHILCSLGLIATAFLSLVMPKGVVSTQITLIVASVTLGLLCLQCLSHLRNFRSFYGFVQLLLSVALILLIGGGIVTHSLSFEQKITMKNHQMMAIDMGAHAVPHTIEIEKIASEDFSKAKVAIAWTINNETTFHETITQTKAFHFKHTAIHLVGMEKQQAILLIQNDWGRAVSFVGGILLMIGLCLYAIPLARPKGREMA